MDALINGLLRATGGQPLAGEGDATFAQVLSCGDTWMLSQLRRQLGLREAIRPLVANRRAGFDVEAMLRAMLLNRLCDQSPSVACCVDVFSRQYRGAGLAGQEARAGDWPDVHRLPKHIRAHALICFLALLLHRLLRLRLKASPSPLSPERLIEMLKATQYHRVALNGKTLLGITTLPHEQVKLFETLGIPKPRKEVIAASA